MAIIGRFVSWLRGWRTMIIAFVLGSIDVLQATDLMPILPPSWVPWWTALHPAVFAYLRFISTTPVGSKEPAITATQAIGMKK